jgi:hypothetical protein
VICFALEKSAFSWYYHDNGISVTDSGKTPFGGVAIPLKEGASIPRVKR